MLKENKELLEKGKGLAQPIGTVKVFNGKKYVKAPEGWKYLKSSDSGDQNKDSDSGVAQPSSSSKPTAPVKRTLAQKVAHHQERVAHHEKQLKKFQAKMAKKQPAKEVEKGAEDELQKGMSGEELTTLEGRKALANKIHTFFAESEDYKALQKAAADNSADYTSILKKLKKGYKEQIGRSLKTDFACLSDSSYVKEIDQKKLKADITTAVKQAAQQ